MEDRDAIWQDTSDSDVDEDNNNVEGQGGNISMQHEVIGNTSGQDGVNERTIYEGRRIILPQEVHDEVVAENIESNQVRDGEVMIVGEDIAVEIVGETAIVADSSDESDDEMAGEGFQLPVINTATTAEILGISSDSEHTTAEFEASEDTIDVGESQSLPTPSSGSSNENAAGPSRSQPHSPFSVFHQNSSILPPPPTTSSTPSRTSKAVSRGKRFPWTSFNNFGFSSDSDDEIDVASRPRASENSDGLSSTAAASSNNVEEQSPRVPRIVADPQELWSFSRAANSLPASRPNFDQRRFLRQISMMESGEADQPVANQEDQLTVAGSSSEAGGQGGRISPAGGTSALARVIHNSGVVASSSNNTGREAHTITQLSSHSRHNRAHYTHGPRSLSSTTSRLSQTPSPQVSPTLARHACTHRIRSSTATLMPNPMFTQTEHTSVSVPAPTNTTVDSQTHSESNRIRLVGDFLRALSSPPIPSVPSLPNTTIRRILSVNTNELLGGDLTSPPTSPQTSMYGPLPLQPQTVRTPRFEPQAGPRAATSQNQDVGQGDNVGEDQRIDRIDRILQLSRRTRVINDTIERSISRDLDSLRANPVPLTMPTSRAAPVSTAAQTSRGDGRRQGQSIWTESSREDVRRQAQRILAEMQQQRREDERRQEGVRRSLERAESATLNFARERVERVAEDVSSEFVRDVPEVETPVAKRARLEPSGQFEADIAEALKRSLADQPREPQPGCSHWDVPVVNDDPDNTEKASDQSNADAPSVEAAAAATVKPAEPTGPDYESLYRSLTTSHRKLVTELQSSLECPVCLDTIRTAPVQCCRNGHLICSLCITRTHICPTCRAPMTLQSGQRCVSHSANRLVDLLPHPCTNRDSGCEVEELLATLTQHEQNCPYRLVRCPIGDCIDNIPMASLSEHVSAFPHLLTTHAYPTISASNTNNFITFSRFIPLQNQGNQNTFELKSFDPIRFTYAGVIFYLQTIRSPDRRFLYSFVQLEGTKEDCNNYWANITVASFNPYTASQVCQTVRPTPLDLHCRDDLQSIGEAIVMTEKVVVSVSQYDTVLARYQFKVNVKIMHNNEVAEQKKHI